MTTAGDMYINTLLEQSPSLCLSKDHTIGIGATSRVLKLPSENSVTKE
eukprot:CAMPEP_0194208656 /NCGR_PEP_ID=MMETSP0156-20130528/7055_1 /TAXON_ID=33649 /ORGANISM="Thalassionema nitzschioides, Strain L26-B" /LENGTH=47 /DNA_ID= /DNA_START= /DNA_END= /DNA_ORIENTATION=